MGKQKQPTDRRPPAAAARPAAATKPGATTPAAATPPASKPVAAPVRPPAAEPPDTVRWAVRLMYAGAVFSVLALIMTLITAGEARSLLRQDEPHLSAAQISSAVHNGIISSVAIWVLTIGLWLVMARTNQAGRGWARVAGTVLCVASTLSFAGYITQAYPLALKVTVVPLWLAGVAATVLLWRPATTSYIRSDQN